MKNSDAMKRTPFQRLPLRAGRMFALTALAVCGALASCSKEETSGGRLFPDGTHPLVLTAPVEAPTSRASVDNVWSGGEQVAVAVDGAVKTYTADDDGTLTSGVNEPFWWRYSDETKTVRAWYCGDGSTTPGRANAVAVPTVWSVAADQSTADSYASGDLLFAPAARLSFSSANALRFYHQTARVVVNIRRAGTVSDERQIKSIAIGDGNLVLSGGFTAPEGDGVTAGTWNIASSKVDGSIAPHKLASTPNGCVASYTALVVPQTMDGKRFIAVTTTAGTMYYTPETGKAQLAAGKVYTYNITVNKDGALSVVTTAGDPEWPGQTEQIVAFYNPDDLKPGDYYYSDGSWSDGGLRAAVVAGENKDYFEFGCMEIAPVLTNPITGQLRRVIGIVFTTDPDRISKAEKELFAQNGWELHGLVVSTRCAANNTACRWFSDAEGNGAYGGRDEAGEIGLPNVTLPGGSDYEDYFAQSCEDIDGYRYNLLIREKRAADLADPVIYQAFSAAMGFADEVGGPSADAQTTGWYLPSAGQWIDIANISQKHIKDYNPKGGLYSEFILYGVHDITLMDKILEKIPEGDRTDFFNKKNPGDYWTSTAVSWGKARKIAFSSSIVSQIDSKYTECYVRCVLAF